MSILGIINNKIKKINFKKQFMTKTTSFILSEEYIQWGLNWLKIKNYL